MDEAFAFSAELTLILFSHHSSPDGLLRDKVQREEDDSFSSRREGILTMITYNSSS